MQELESKKVKLTTATYTAFIKACGTSPGLVDAAHAAFKRMVWGPRRMKPNQVTFVTTMRVLREASRPHQALDVYLGMRRAGQSHAICHLYSRLYILLYSRDSSAVWLRDRRCTFPHAVGSCCCVCATHHSITHSLTRMSTHPPTLALIHARASWLFTCAACPANTLGLGQIAN